MCLVSIHPQAMLSEPSSTSKSRQTWHWSIFLTVALATFECASSFTQQPNSAASTSYRHRQPPSTQSRSTAEPAASSTTHLFMMGEMEEIECDVAIVGGGPAGCTCALYTSRADLSTVILDKNPAVGALAITSHIANYPGVDRSMSGADLLDQMKTQAIQYGTRVERAQVFMIEIKDDDGDNPYNKIVYTPAYLVKARALVLATGAMGRSLPPLPGEEKYLGSGVSYCATCDGAFYRDSEVAVYGATGEAIEEALFLTKFASTVHWITPIDVLEQLEKKRSMANVEFNEWFDPDVLEDLLDKPNVKHWNKVRMLSVEGDASGVTGVKVKKISQDEEEIIPVEGAFIYGAGGGSKPITDFVQGAVELDETGGVIVNADMETSKKGVFAIGDIRNTPYKQVVVAAADGCIAAMSIEKFLKGRKIIKVDWVHR
ncbi:FAD-dependent pyridine nucleotide-disulfide oxidoreductase [Nitzschia inconspicua]|uniref:FAD-dependent pyridine nucleotide-disulfide oxidoreductase n=1 Tax=Nitzschia inconspicua TaxID=303405 RepID=A0A9K3LNK9_9STRA|nr:FAD-dependent pyridine nucleotide-disulfide oxidoreductase [Nitzschia inconspicua]